MPAAVALVAQQHVGRIVAGAAHLADRVAIGVLLNPIIIVFVITVEQIVMVQRPKQVVAIDMSMRV
jgi:hypothetical protein